MEKRNFLRQFLLVFVITFGMIFLVLRSNLIGRVSYQIEKGRIEALRESLPPDDVLQEASVAARTVAQIMIPAVVSIETEIPASPVLDRMLDKFRSGDDDSQSEQRREWLQDHLEDRIGGLGSGCVIDADGGLVLTNHHVIADSERITVRLHDGRRYKAEVVGVDPDTDLAVLRIDADRLHQASFGDSDAVQVGDDVLALGNPFGLTSTVSKGIISAKGRSPVAVADVTYKGFLQTDASINPGNSGGPLVNLRGEIIGINTAIASESGRYEGVGFAIPSARVQALLPKLVKGESIVRGFLGISLVGISEYPEYAEELGYKQPDGILVNSVVAESGADQADIRPDDIIVELDGQPIADADAFREDIAKLTPGTVVPLKVWRDGKTLSIDVILGRRLER